jgi:uncharacterized membrane protein
VNVAAVSAGAPNRLWPRVGWVLLFLGALFAAGNAVMFMTIDAHGDPGIKGRFLGTAVAGWAHTMGGAVAALIGPFQFLSRLRTAMPRVHVWMGRTYLIAVLCGALGGLYFAPTSPAGLTATLGFSILAVWWLYTGARAYQSIRRREFAVHRQWMIRNYSLTFAAATLRMQLPLLVMAGVHFPLVLGVVAWTSWVPNALLAEAWLRHRPRPRP